MAPQCQALNISDGQHCKRVATAANNLFCKFHGYQCYGLYKGYKRRNAELDELTANPPPFLAQTKIPLSTQDFADIDDESILQDVHSYLYKRLELLNKVIRARKLHHSRFYPLQLDYGHQAYLDKLQGQKFTVLRALERLVGRTMDVSHNKHKWFKWIRQRQLEEEAKRENEKAKVKAEAGLFKRHQMELVTRLKAVRAKEEQKQQDLFLEQALKERMEADDADWDPIEDVIADERGSYIDLVRHFLWIDSVQETDTTTSPGNKSSPNDTENEVQNEDLAPTPKNNQDLPKAKKKSKTKQVDASKATDHAVGTVQKPAKENIETQAEMRQRLLQGEKCTQSSAGLMILPTIENPGALQRSSPSLTLAEVDELIPEIVEIKHLLFCRLLLSHTALLPVALKAGSVEEFLADPEVLESDLRDLCLKMERPTLQSVRDACADLKRVDEEYDDDDSDVGDDSDEENHRATGSLRFFDERLQTKKGAVPTKWKPKHELPETIGEDILQDKGTTIVDFGQIDDNSQRTKKKIRVKVCGRDIWNYASESELSRRGWLHFCIIAKDCDLFQAMELCRNWDEFAQLNMLVVYHYFPASNWRQWIDDRTKQQLLQLGFIPYAWRSSADSHTLRFQTGSRSLGPRKHALIECRNLMCGHMKRGDPITRRFIQYLVMQPSKTIILVRDGKTGRFITKPEDEHLWLIRQKEGVGRATKNPWRVLEQIDEVFFEKSDKERKWRFSFSDYYDIYIWDTTPGLKFWNLYNVITQTLIKAHRITQPKDLYKHQESFLRTIVRDPMTFRARDMKPGEAVVTLWEEVSESTFHMSTDMVYRDGGDEDEDDKRRRDWKIFYNEADTLEDSVLFPDELDSTGSVARFRKISNTISQFINEGPELSKWVNDLDIDDSDPGEPMSDDENDEWSNEDSLADEPPRWNTGLNEILANAILEKLDPDITRRRKSVLSEDEQKANALIIKWADERDENEGYEKEDMRGQWVEFIDRHKSAPFKHSFHASDMEPGAQEKYDESKRLIDAIEKNEMKKLDKARFCIFILDLLGIQPFFEKRSQRDVVAAFAKICPFFPEHKVASISDLLNSEAGLEFKDSLLFKPSERAKSLPNRRSHTSNHYRPEEFWVDWESKITRVESRRRNEPNYLLTDRYPLEWDVIIRPILAQLYKQSIIKPSYKTVQDTNGIAVALKEPGRNKRDFYLDYRRLGDISAKDGIIPLKPNEYLDLRACAREFAKRHPLPRFALLRIWSNEYFWPLMLGWDNRQTTSFIDAMGNPWEWTFIPKDMPESECSIHIAIEKHLTRYRKQLKVHGRHGGPKGAQVPDNEAQVIVRRDLVLVMAVDEDECLRLTTGVTYAVQARPWLREVDVWKSFINVDLQFLEQLDKVWIE